MREFLTAQLDYIYFIYGLAFVLLAAVCATMRREPGPRLPWLWLGLFGLIHGINEWLDMLVLPLGDSATFGAVRLSVLALSFLFLLEFARSGWRKLAGRGPGRWMHIPLLVGAAAGALVGLPGLNVTVRYSLGLSGALWSALTLFRASRTKDGTWVSLMLAALAMAGYAIAAGAVVPQAPFLHTWAARLAAFVPMIGIKLLRTVLAVSLSASLWVYRQRQQRALAEPALYTRTRHGLQIAFVLVISLAGGWIATQESGNHGDRDMRESIRSDAGIAASAIKAKDIERLTGTASDTESPDYRSLRDQLKRMHKADLQFRSVQLLIRSADGKIVFAADSIPKNKPDHMEPGAESYQPPKELFGVMAGQPVLAGPYTDEVGPFFSAFAPVRDSSTGRIVAVLGIDVDATQWRRDIAEYRLGPIAATFLVSVLLIVFFVARRRLWESAERLKHTLADEKQMVHELQNALAEVKTLRGLLPICANCKRIRDDKGQWTQVENYIQQRSDAQFTHGCCPDCLKKLYPEYTGGGTPGGLTSR